eukprot:116650_1
MHDVGHNGMNNAFHIQSKSNLFVMNNKSPLEHYHIIIGFGTMSANMECDWFSDLDKQLVKSIENGICKIILETDHNEKHKQHKTFIDYLVNKIGDNTLGWTWMDKDEKMSLLSALVHIADISNAAKCWNLCKIWAELCINEFRSQGVKEKELFGAESGNLMKSDYPLEESQTGWINFVMVPIIEPLVKVVPETTILLDNLKNNLKKWGNFKELE